MWTKPPVWLAVRSVLRPVAQPQQAAQVHLRQRAPASSSPRFFFLAATRLPPSQNAASSDGTLSLRTCLDAVGSASAPAVLGASRARGLHLLASRPQRISRRTAGFDAAAQVSGRRGVLQSASHHLEDNSGDEEPRGLTDVQKRLLFIQAAVPMIGFGFMDNMVMIFMGDLIDSTLGVTFGLSTLTAAGFGQIFSDVSGVCFGGTVEALFNKSQT
ncbi:hypothetical protein T484DRAFT_1838987 [Baffinella frigidus]|nr:hypothetical protein T484DRAFT_1838987 [Cryptophyta sp. CCMP2293]